jgi:hypothetical protein
MGLTALSASMAAPSFEAGLMHEVGVRLPERSLWVLRHAERYGSRAAAALLSMIPTLAPVVGTTKIEAD